MDSMAATTPKKRLCKFLSEPDDPVKGAPKVHRGDDFFDGTDASTTAAGSSGAAESIVFDQLTVAQPSDIGDAEFEQQPMPTTPFAAPADDPCPHQSAAEIAGSILTSDIPFTKASLEALELTLRPAAQREGPDGADDARRACRSKMRNAMMPLPQQLRLAWLSPPPTWAAVRVVVPLRRRSCQEHHGAAHPGGGPPQPQTENP